MTHNLEEILRKIKTSSLPVLQLSKEIGVSHDKLYRWLSKKTSVKTDDFVKLQDWYNRTFTNKKVNTSLNNRYTPKVGLLIKNAIKEAGFTLDSAATILQMSRQTLYINLHKANISDEFIQSIRDNFSKYFNVDDILNTPISDYDNGWEDPQEDPPKDGMKYYIDKIEKLMEDLGEKNKIIANLRDSIADKIVIINLKDKIITDLEKEVEAYKAKVVNTGKTGGRHRHSA